MQNELIHETSPYLLQHAHNPVHWQVWGDKAFQLAKDLNRPVLVSIGYATCHWCHVMERESFESEQTAAFMNQHFVCIKLDREERPDVDALLMEVVQMISGNGGWPLNCFLLPDGRPFFAGTYFPDTPKYGRTTWLQLLDNLQKAYNQRYEEVEAQAEQITDYLQKTQRAFTAQANSLQFDNQDAANSYLIYDYFQTVFHNLRDNFDRINGGFGGAPKFPSTFALRFCLNFDFLQNNPDASAQAHLSLRKMAQAGIYDQIGGGFARYATDPEWNIPHFEKMLYDNALLLALYSDAYATTTESSTRNLYQRVCAQSFSWLQREMKDPTGLYFSAIDADSEGHEGLFYLWDYQAVKNTLTEEEFAIYSRVFDLQEQGNWEGKNILYYKETVENFARYYDLDLTATAKRVETASQKLLTVRNGRIRPITDDKLMLDWNALLAQAFCRMYRSFGNVDYYHAAETILKNGWSLYQIRPDAPDLYHTYKLGKGKNAAFLDDYSFLIGAWLEFYQLNSEEIYLQWAKTYADLVIQQFYDDNDGLFYLSNSNSDVLIRKKDLYDNATPSGNSVMVHNLLILSALLDNSEYYRIAERLLKGISDAVKKFPQSFSHYANALLRLQAGCPVIIAVGENYQQLLTQLYAHFLPNYLIIGGKDSSQLQHLPIAEGKTAPEGKTYLYFCRAQTCTAPVETVAELLKLLKG